MRHVLQAVGLCERPQHTAAKGAWRKLCLGGRKGGAAITSKPWVRHTHMFLKGKSIQNTLDP